MRTEKFPKKNSQVEDSVYLYDPDNKDLYNEVLENLNKNDCIFGRNLLAYLEDQDRADNSFYRKHLMSCKSCQLKAGEYRSMKDQIQKTIPERKLNPDLLAMLRSEIKDSIDHFSKDRDSIERINWGATFKSSLIEFSKGFFFSREIVLGFLLATSLLLFILLFK